VILKDVNSGNITYHNVCGCGYVTKVAQLILPSTTYFATMDIADINFATAKGV
jgi:hypothetical protein